MLHNLTLPTYDHLMDRVVEFQRQFIAFICDANAPTNPLLQDYCKAFKSDGIAQQVEKWMQHSIKTGSRETYHSCLCKLLDYLRRHPEMRQILIDAFDHDIAYFDKLQQGNMLFVFFCTTKTELKRREEIRKLLDPLMIAFYEEQDLFTKGFHPDIAAINKSTFRTMFWETNPLKVCPSCDGPRTDSPYEIDHFFPKAIYPFLSMHRANLVPICIKCNSYEKRAKDPLDQSLPDPFMHSFHPFGKPALKEIKIKVCRDTTSKKCQVKIEEKDGSVSRRIKKLNAIFNLEGRWEDFLKDAIDNLIVIMQGQAERRKVKGVSTEEIVDDALETILDAGNKRIGQEPHYLVRKAYAMYALNDPDEKEMFLEIVRQESGYDGVQKF